MEEQPRRLISIFARGLPRRAGGAHGVRNEGAVEFGLQFFPNVVPDEVPAERWFADALNLVELSEPLGYKHVRIVEHYFHKYGGYSPNPLIFLAAAAQRTKATRLITGAVLPVFNNPLKLAGEIGMIDALSDGRLEVGFARAFLPHEFSRFGVALDESRERFDEGLEAVRRLLEEENVEFRGRFHAFPPTTSLPRPTQKPRPPFWVAALSTEASFANAGTLGHSVMAIPIGGSEMRRLIGVYRDAWKAAGHPGEGRVMIAFHMYCHESDEEAVRIAREPLTRYFQGLVDAASDWTQGKSSKDYPGYDKIIAKLREGTFESQIEQGSALVGTPQTVARQLEAFIERVGPFEIASLQVNFSELPFEEARRSMQLFASQVMPRFTTQRAIVPA
jgi:alkanesulfonate monooxygenase SsuD/methylene tetrahydromethanopterin reductase-like flavin-dependent oxidoreductase (luciferase family)